MYIPPEVAMAVSCLPLQACCFVKLIKEFEAFPPESLALLPLRLRYELIQNLPAVDVCQLEQSSFVEGLDMEKVWATLCLQRKGFLPTGITAASGNKDVYFSGVCKILLNGHRKPDHQDADCARIFNLLFGYFGIGDWFVHQLEKFLVPSRYYSYLARPEIYIYHEAQLLALVLRMSHYYYPKSLHCNEHFPLQYWGSAENYNLLGDYLKEVCNLHLSHPFYNKHHALHFHKFIPHILSKRLLSSLVLEGIRGDLLENTLLALSPLLTGDKGSHSQLKTFEIIHNRSYCNISDAVASEISRVLVANQTSLHTIELTSGSIPHHLCSCLSSFFKHPHLRLIHLSAPLQLGSLQEILYAFLTTPRSSSSGEVCLHIQDFALKSKAQDMSGFKRHLLCLQPPKNNHCKSLVLSFSHVELPHPLITWLQERVVLRLKKLELYLGIAHCFLNHQQMEVEEFCIVTDRISGKICDRARSMALKYLETPGCFDDVLGNKYLKRFRFTTRELTSEIVLNLARGLHKQAEVGNLEELNLSYHPCGFTPEIFEAIFSLPQIEKLTLAINSDFIDNSYLAMLKRSWREKAGGKQLKKLIVTCTGLGHCSLMTVQTLQSISRELMSSCENV